MKTVILLVLTVAFASPSRAASTITTLIGTGIPGFSDTQVNNPYGMTIGPDGALFWCDLDNQRVRRLDLATKRVTTVAGNGQKGYTGDGGPAANATLAAPHELVFDAKGDVAGAINVSTPENAIDVAESDPFSRGDVAGFVALAGVALGIVGATLSMRWVARR